tara:strand:+ start:4815 stop:5801 length:987 start_codon:yes stop_codon:yes gene_type:complete
MASDGRIIKNLINSFNTFNEGSTAMKRKRERDIATAIATGRALAPVPYGGEVPVRPEPQMALPPTFPDAVGITPPAPVPAPLPATTVKQDLANNTVSALTQGANNSTMIGNANRKAAMGKTLMGGDMGSFMGNLLRMFAQPEFQQAGFAGQGFGPTVLGATNALRAMDTQDTEAAKLEAAANAAALEQAASLRGEERAVRGLDIQAERADIARTKAEQDKLREASITGPKIDAFVSAIKGNTAFTESIDSLTGGNFLQRLAPGVQGGPGREDVVRAVALEAAKISNQNPRISSPDAIRQAIANIKAGGSTATESTNGNGVDPFAKVGG